MTDEMLVRTAYDKAAIYQMRAADTLDINDLAHAKAYAALGNALRDRMLENEGLTRELEERGGVLELHRLRVEDMETERDSLLADLDYIRGLALCDDHRDFPTIFNAASAAIARTKGEA